MGGFLFYLVVVVVVKRRQTHSSIQTTTTTSIILTTTTSSIKEQQQQQHKSRSIWLDNVFILFHFSVYPPYIFICILMGWKKRKRNFLLLFAFCASYSSFVWVRSFFAWNHLVTFIFSFFSFFLPWKTFHFHFDTQRTVLFVRQAAEAAKGKMEDEEEVAIRGCLREGVDFVVVVRGGERE